MNFSIFLYFYFLAFLLGQSLFSSVGVSESHPGPARYPSEGLYCPCLMVHTPASPTPQTNYHRCCYCLFCQNCHCHHCHYTTSAATTATTAAATAATPLLAIFMQKNESTHRMLFFNDFQSHAMRLFKSVSSIGLPTPPRKPQALHHQHHHHNHRQPFHYLFFQGQDYHDQYRVIHLSCQILFSYYSKTN